MDSENQIPILHLFIEALENHLTQECKKNLEDIYKIDIVSLGVDVIYQEFKRASIGCEENCPMCG